MISLSARNIKIENGSKIICDHLNIDMRAGEIWGLLGVNGCGKTTLLHALCGIHLLSAGEIYLGKNKLLSLSRKSIAQSIGVLFQQSQTTFSQTVWEYCLTSRYPHMPYFKRESDGDIRIVTKALAQMSLTHLQSRPITQLSGGERRRLDIACVLAQTPEIYILDEPTNHLDLHHQMKVLKYFRELSDCVIVMSLHDVNLAQQYCDQIIMLFADGEILQGQTEATLTEPLLTKLYQHPITKIAADDKQVFWYAKESAYTSYI